MMKSSWFLPARNECPPDPPTGGAGYVRVGFKARKKVSFEISFFDISAWIACNCDPGYPVRLDFYLILVKPHNYPVPFNQKILIS